MKKIISILTLALLLVGCHKADLPPIPQDEFKVIVIDSCEYIEYEDGRFNNTHVYSLTHKGNCKFCKIRNK